MLKAIEVKNALKELLKSNSNGFVVVTPDKRSFDALDMEIPQVLVGFDSGQFDRGRSTVNTAAVCIHSVTLRVSIIAAAKADVDLSVLQNPEATPAQLAEALAAQVSSEDKVETILDNVVGSVFNIIMRPSSRSFYNEFINHWVQNIQYDTQVQQSGALCVKGARFTIVFYVNETVSDTEPVGIGNINSYTQTDTNGLNVGIGVTVNNAS